MNDAAPDGPLVNDAAPVGPVASGGAAPGAPPPTVPGSAVTFPPDAVDGRTTAAPARATGTSPGVDLLAPRGEDLDLDALVGPPAAGAEAPGTVEAPAGARTTVLRTLARSDPTGVESASTAEALSRARRPPMPAPAIGAAILAALAGFAARRRTAGR